MKCLTKIRRLWSLRLTAVLLVAHVFAVGVAIAHLVEVYYLAVFTHVRRRRLKLK